MRASRARSRRGSRVLVMIVGWSSEEIFDYINDLDGK